MKKLLVTLTGVLSIGAVLPAFAGPDWQLIEQGRKAKAASTQQVEQQAQTSESSASGTSQSTDGNAGMEQMMKECAEMMKTS